MDKSAHNYRGKKSVTVSGRRCQRWTSNTPHKHDYMNSGVFPDDTVADASNYCRNPDANYKLGLWCYTIDRNVRWEHCEVPVCGKIKTN